MEFHNAFTFDVGAVRQTQNAAGLSDLVNKELENGCIHKRAYITQHDAARTGQRVYRCRVCRMWHRSGPLVKLRNPVIRPDFRLDIKV